MNLDVNKDECSVEHLQQVTQGTRALITETGCTKRTDTTSSVKDVHFAGDFLIGWLHDSPFSWPLSWHFLCSSPSLYSCILLSQETGLFSEQVLSPANHSLKVAFSSLPFSTLKTFPKFFQNLLDTSQPCPLALRFAAFCCFHQMFYLLPCLPSPTFFWGSDQHFVLCSSQIFQAHPR